MASLALWVPAWGLSPRVRGNRARHRGPEPGPGSIPACAGEPEGALLLARVRGVYPRVCGGTYLCQSWLPHAEGLSPRVRGNPGVLPGRRQHAGSIPACAGEPAPRTDGSVPIRVYPRVCGGTGSRIRPRPGSRGLSPRVRGNPAAAAPSRRRMGSIPACAGEPTARTWSPPGAGVYPRVCGGTTYRTRKAAGTKGLSPRVRGNLRLALLVPVVRGSIPACAGEPNAFSRRCGKTGVYPRVCGGTGGLSAVASSSRGLSPRVRGNQDGPERAEAFGGSIPACAGEPTSGATLRRSFRVYPRVCGGTRSRKSAPL